MPKGEQGMKKQRLVKWSRSEDGYTNSKDGRFTISPQYEGTCSAQSYRLDDTLTGNAYTEDTQRMCKRAAERTVEKEMRG